MNMFIRSLTWTCCYSDPSHEHAVNQIFTRISCQSNLSHDPGVNQIIHMNMALIKRSFTWWTWTCCSSDPSHEHAVNESSHMNILLIRFFTWDLVGSFPGARWLSETFFFGGEYFWIAIWNLNKKTIYNWQNQESDFPHKIGPRNRSNKW